MNRYQKTELFIKAIMKNDLNEIKRLVIEEKVDVNETKTIINGGTPLMIAARINGKEVTELLIEHGADVNAFDNDGWSVLMFAIENKATKTAELLIQQGANVNATTKSGMTPLMIAARKDEKDIAELLIKNGSNVNAIDKDGWSPLMHTASKNSLKTSELLLKYGADVNAFDNDGWSALMISASEDTKDIAEMLIRHGAHINVTDNEGRTALMFAAENNSIRTLELIIHKVGADVNAVDKDNWTALMIAASSNSKEAAAILLKYGADINAVDNDDWSALRIAAHENAKETAKLLIENGADKNLTANAGKTAQIMIEQEEAKETVEFLSLETFVKNLDTPENKALSDNKERCFSQEEFDNCYGYLADDLSNPASLTEFKKYYEIAKHLDYPLNYLEINGDMGEKFNQCLEKHPNIIDIDKLRSWFKVSIQFSLSKMIYFDRPLLFVGPPGCGKTMLCKELSNIFGQNNRIFLPMGAGGGVSKLMGSTPEYKDARYGEILSSIWKANNTNTACCGNPIIIIDEIDKSCLSNRTGDINQNLYPCLIQLFGDENRTSFRDNFFGLEIRNVFFNYLLTANELEPIPEPLLDRVNVIRFRDYNKNEMQNIVIPNKYKLFRETHSKVLPEKLNLKDIETIYDICGNSTRAFNEAIFWFVANFFDANGNRISKQYNLPTHIENNRHQIGFCL